MKLSAIVIAVLSILPSTAGIAQVYRWVDSGGKVHFSDQPPPPDVRSFQQKKLPIASAEEESLPYAVREATRNFPVILFTDADCGESCSKGKELLTKRGVPFAEKNARRPQEAEALKKRTGGVLEVPVLGIGNTTLRGFDEDRWHRGLDFAGYPRTAVVRSPGPAATARAEASPKAPAKPPEDSNAVSAPVTLYTSDCGEPCTRAKELLQKRGVPFVERGVVNPADVAALQRLVGPNNTVVPLLVVGDTALPGFNEGQWNSELDAAGYPKTP